METVINCIDKERSRAEIDEILQLAKLTANDVLPTSQVIHFTSNNLHDNHYKLLELDSHLMQTLNEGDTLFIKGSSDENVVICSDTRTYDVTETETSDSLLLVNGLQFKNDITNTDQKSISKITVSGIFYEYLEPSVTRPYLQKLSKILSTTVYKGPEFETEVNINDLLTYDDLLNNIQASKRELDSALELLHICIIDDKIRLIDFEYHFRILSYMLKLIEENSWSLDGIDYDETLNSLDDLAPVVVLNKLFDVYTEPSKIIDGLQLYKYKELDVCKFFAQVLLAHAGKFNFTEFLQAWSESVPDGMVPNEEMLYGIAIVDKTCIPHVVRAFREDTLPENINERFKILFDVKQKWKVPEIAPYIERLTTDKMDVNAFLAKYARASTMGGIKYYSAKHAK